MLRLHCFYLIPQPSNAFSLYVQDFETHSIMLLGIVSNVSFFLSSCLMYDGIAFEEKKKKKPYAKWYAFHEMDEGTRCDTNYDTCTAEEENASIKRKILFTPNAKTKTKRFAWCFMQISSSFRRTCEYSSLHFSLVHDVCFWNNSQQTWCICAYLQLFLHCINWWPVFYLIREIYLLSSYHPH